VLEAVFILLDILSPLTRIFIGSHSPPSMVHRFSPSALIVTVFQLLVVTSPVVMAIIVPMATSVIAAVVFVAT
jgi:hypothetical protein